MQEADKSQFEGFSAELELGPYMSDMVINEQTDDDKKFSTSQVDKHDHGNIESLLDQDHHLKSEFQQSGESQNFTEMLVISQIRSDFNNDDPFMRHIIIMGKAIAKAIRNIVISQHLCETKEQFQTLQNQHFRSFLQDISVGFITGTGQLKSTAYVWVNNSLVDLIHRQQILLQFKRLNLKITAYFTSTDIANRPMPINSLIETQHSFSSIQNEERKQETMQPNLSSSTLQLSIPSKKTDIEPIRSPSPMIPSRTMPIYHLNDWMKQAFIRTDKFKNQFIEIQNPQDKDLKSGISIHFVYRPIDDQIYAVKKSCLESNILTFYDVFSTMYLQEPTRDQRKIREAKILAKLCHPNVLRLYDWWIEQERNGSYALYMQLEYCSFPGITHQTNDLLNYSYYYLNPMPNSAKIQKIKTIMLQIVDGLEYIHHRGIVHRDLKPENIFVTITITGDLQVMLADFDQGKDVREIKLSAISEDKITDQELNSIRSRNTIQSGTSGYQTPNSNKNEAYDQCDEFFALGITLLHLVLTFPGEPKIRNHYATTFGMSDIKDVLSLFDNWATKYVRNRNEEFNFECFVSQFELAKKLLDKRVNSHDQIRQIIQSW